jgi:hypothetical protein
VLYSRLIDTILVCDLHSGADLGCVGAWLSQGDRSLSTLGLECFKPVLKSLSPLAQSARLILRVRAVQCFTVGVQVCSVLSWGWARCCWGPLAVSLHCFLAVRSASGLVFSHGTVNETDP